MYCLMQGTVAGLARACVCVWQRVAVCVCVWQRVAVCVCVRHARARLRPAEDVQRLNDDKEELYPFFVDFSHCIIAKGISARPMSCVQDYFEVIKSPILQLFNDTQRWY